MRRSANWRHLFNPASGMVEPRFADGALPHPLRQPRRRRLRRGQLRPVHLDGAAGPRRPVRRIGGPRRAAARLDRFLRELNGGPGGTHTDHALLGNEPTLQTPWLYDWMRRPYRTQAAVRRALLGLYDTSPDGYPGNDDLGTLSAWYVFGALGLYPEVPGVGVLAIGSPLFARAEIRLPHRRRALILAAGRSYDERRRQEAPAPGALARPGAAPYIQSLRLNGRAYAALDHVLRPRPRRHPLLPPGAAAEPPLGHRGRRRAALLRAPAARCREGDLRPPSTQRSRAALVGPSSGLSAALTALGVAVRFASLGVQSYHHDEVITALRVLPGSFGDMLHAVKVSESNPPLYYVLGWAWAKAFGTGEVGLRSLSALFGAATVPVGYLIGRQLAGRRAGLILAALIAVNPMLIWYSQEARSYALLVFFGALARFFFVRALDTRPGRDLACWALASALALCSHYFAVFAVAIEALWLLVALRARWRLLLPALAAVGAAGLALLPLANSQTNPTHIGWIENSPLAERFWETGVCFLAGETGHVSPSRRATTTRWCRCSWSASPLLAVALRGEPAGAPGGALGLVVGLGVIGPDRARGAGRQGLRGRAQPAAGPGAAAGGRRTRVRRRRRPPARAAPRGRALRLLDRLRRPRHPDAEPAAPRLPHRHRRARTGRRPRAIVTWKLAADPVRCYLPTAVRLFGGGNGYAKSPCSASPWQPVSTVNFPPSFSRWGGSGPTA